VAPALGRHLGVLCAYLVPAVVVFWHVWDGHPTATLTCACGDAGQLVWFVAWPAYALAHGTNPFFSTMLWAPHGANLLANESSLLVGTVLAPVTWVWGPVATVNVALTLAPALSAWACWAACRRLVASRWAPWVAGLLYGFSPFVVSSARQGHLALALLVFPPLVVLGLDSLVVRQRGPAWRPGLALGAVVAAQFLVAPDVLVMTAVVAVVGLAVLAATGRRELSGRLPYALRGSAVAVGVAAGLGALPLWFALTGPRHLVGPAWPGLNAFGDSLEALVRAGPAPAASRSLLFGAASQPAANLGLTGPPAAYLGVGAVAVALASLVVARRRRATWVLAASGATAWVMSLGAAAFRTDALSALPWLPWQSLVGLPVLDDVLPGRFALCTDLAVALVVAIGIDGVERLLTAPPRALRRTPGPLAVRRERRTGRAPWREVALSCALGAVVLVPVWRLYALPAATQHVALPPWFSSAARAVPAGAVVLTYPFPASASVESEPMIWQAEDTMHFRLAGGYVKVPGPGGAVLTTGAPGTATNTLVTVTLVPQTARSSLAVSPARLEALRRALSRWQVSYVVVTDTGTNPVFVAALMTAVVGDPPRLSQRAWVWHLAPPGPAGPYDAAAAASAFDACRQRGLVFQAPPPRRPLPGGATTCVAARLGT
jgi:hypothetical protein